MWRQQREAARQHGAFTVLLGLRRRQRRATQHLIRPPSTDCQAAQLGGVLLGQSHRCHTVLFVHVCVCGPRLRERTPFYLSTPCSLDAISQIPSYHWSAHNLRPLALVCIIVPRFEQYTVVTSPLASPPFPFHPYIACHCIPPASPYYMSKNTIVKYSRDIHMRALVL